MTQSAVSGIALLVLLAVGAVRAPAAGPALSPEAAAALEKVHAALIDEDRATARAEALTLIKLAPDYFRAYDLYSFTMSGPDRATAAEEYRKLAAATPDQAIYWYALGRLSGDPGERAAAFDKVVALRPDAPWGYFGQAHVARNRDDLERAIELYAKAYGMAPDETGLAAGYIVGMALWIRRNEGAPQVAQRKATIVEVFDRLAKAAPRSFDTHSALATIATTIDASWPKRYCELFPGGPMVGRAYEVILNNLAEKDPAAARVQAREVLAKLRSLKRAEAFEEARVSIFDGLILQPAVNEGQAAVDKLAAELLASNENSPGIFLAIGRTYLSSTADARTGIALVSRGWGYQQAVKDGESESVDEYRYTLGLLYSRNNEPQRAVEVLDGVKSEYFVSKAAAARGAAYEMLGDKNKAFDAYVVAVSVSPTTANLKALTEAAIAVGKTPADVDAAVWAVRDASAKLAADFTLAALDGPEVTLSKARGKVVLLNFWHPG
jgi:tetratricopeptide (TPR) repeat protein